MFIIRNAVQSDLDNIFELSQLMKFINIPDDRDLLEKKISKSQQSFKGQLKPDSSLYMFVLEDLTLKKVIGVSLIHGLHGTEEEPHFFLSVNQENKYSKSLNTGFIHGTLKFGHLTSGYSEIGGLILDPSYRGHEQKLGKALSFARFLFIAYNKELFTNTIHVELMPPFDSEGKSPLWEALGRRFLNMDYHEADILSRKNKEFILSLFPQDTIYETLLPLDARDAIGKVGDKTKPVKNMLENIGFEYINEVDPFDGGPHYRAKIDDISVIKDVCKLPLEAGKVEKEQTIITCQEHDQYDFYAPLILGDISNDKIQTNKETKTLFSSDDVSAIKY